MSGVALVFPYFRTRARTEVLFPPLGPALLSAHLKGAGVEARVFDGTFSSLEALVDDVAAWRPAVVGISSMVSLTGTTLRVATALRERLPDALLVAGGPLPTVFPGRFLPHVDLVFRGEADISFPTFCRDYVACGATRDDLGGLPLARYPGLVADIAGRRIDNPPVHHPEDEIAGFPLPDRGDFDHRAYQDAWAPTGHRPTTLIATLGCPYGCEFCSKPVFGDAVRLRPLDRVLAEVEDIVRLGYDGLWIADDTFTLRPDYLEGFCRRVAPLRLTWSCLSRANGIDPATARLMKDSGCRRVYLGLESGSQATLDLMRKQMTVEQSVRAASVYREAGIEVAAFFIVGYPGETVADIETTLSFALELPLAEISFNVPMPLPGSGLWERLGGRDEGRDWTHENEPTFVFGSDIDQDWLRRRIDETMAAFAAKRPGAA
ncbi:MAG: B12-binding domain-containing radical SAM protein [Deltaproteobacteria bacterium]